MSVLPDRDIKKKIDTRSLIIDPFFPDFVGPNLYYCHLGNKFLIPRKDVVRVDPLSMETKDIYDAIETDQPIIIKPQEFILAETFEYLGIDSDHVVKLMNSSSLARVGISHAAVGMINAGCGVKRPVKLTLELINNAPFEVVLTPTTIKDGLISWGTEVLKIAIMKMDSRPDIAYDEWNHAVYNTDQKPSGPKMKNRFTESKEFYLPKKSLYNK